MAVFVFGDHLWTRAFRMFLHSWRLGLQWMEKTHLIEDPITWQEDLLQGEKSCNSLELPCSQAWVNMCFATVWSEKTLRVSSLNSLCSLPQIIMIRYEWYPSNIALCFVSNGTRWKRRQLPVFSDYCPRHASENPKLPAKLKAEICMWDWPQRLMGCGRMSNIGHHAYQTNASQTVGFLKRKYYDSWDSSVWDDSPRPKELDLLAVSFWQLELKTDKPWLGSGQELGITFIGPPSGVMAASGAPKLDIGIFFTSCRCDHSGFFRPQKV